MDQLLALYQDVTSPGGFCRTVSGAQPPLATSATTVSGAQWAGQSHLNSNGRNQKTLGHRVCGLCSGVGWVLLYFGIGALCIPQQSSLL